MNDVIIYGAYGYTGRLIVEQAVAKGWKPTIAGRNGLLVKALADKYNLPNATFNFDDAEAWDSALSDKKLLINCAGPFDETVKDILPACLRNKTHYTDINGNIEVFQYIESNDQKAKDAEIVLMPGTGFDVVPTDCLAKYLSEQLPSATHLEIAFDSSSGLSRGTALSVLGRIHKGSAVRENGVIKERPASSVNKIIQFGDEEKNAVGIAWGDIFTAFHTTGIPNIQVYTGMSVKLMNIMRRAGKWSWLIKSRIIQKLGAYYIRKKIDGPSAEKRENLKCYIWGKVNDQKGKEVSAQMTTPESYKLTAMATLLCANKILNNEAKPGYQTPAGAFGSDLILEIDGVTRKLLVN